MMQSAIIEKRWIEMIEAFRKLTPEQRHQEAERRLDETLERMARIHNISIAEAYERLIINHKRMYR